MLCAFRFGVKIGIMPHYLHIPYFYEKGKMKNKTTAYILWLVSVFGWLGFHRFYLGKVSTGIIWIFTGGALGVGALIDLFTLGGMVDQYNTKEELKTIRASALAKDEKSPATD